MDILNNKNGFYKIYLFKNHLSPKKYLSKKCYYPNLLFSYYPQGKELEEGSIYNSKIYYKDNNQIIIQNNLVIISIEKLMNDEYKTCKLLETVNLTDKYLVRNYLEKLTNNITELSLHHENYFNFFDTSHFYGSKIQLSIEFETVMVNEDLRIKKIKFQFLDNIVVTIRDGNIVEFNENANDEQKLLFFYMLEQILN